MMMMKMAHSSFCEVFIWILWNNIHTGNRQGDFRIKILWNSVEVIFLTQRPNRALCWFFLAQGHAELAMQ